MSGVRRRSYRRPGRVVPPTARGLRARTVRLQRGEIMEWHSTHQREELLIAFVGVVDVEVSTAAGTTRRFTVTSGECAFLPSETLHRVVNRSRRSASYLYVTAPTS